MTNDETRCIMSTRADRLWRAGRAGIIYRRAQVKVAREREAASVFARSRFANNHHNHHHHKTASRDDKEGESRYRALHVARCTILQRAFSIAPLRSCLFAALALPRRGPQPLAYLFHEEVHRRWQFVRLNFKSDH